MMLNEGPKKWPSRSFCRPTKTGDKVVRLSGREVFVPKSYHEAYRNSRRGVDQRDEKRRWGGRGMPASRVRACYELFTPPTFPSSLPGADERSGRAHRSVCTKGTEGKYMGRMYRGSGGGTMVPHGAGTGAIRRPQDHGEEACRQGPTALRATRSSSRAAIMTSHQHRPRRSGADRGGSRGDERIPSLPSQVPREGRTAPSVSSMMSRRETSSTRWASKLVYLHACFGEDGKCVGELMGGSVTACGSCSSYERSETGSGHQALGCASAAYEHAVQYAKDRIQGTEIFEMKNPDARPVRSSTTRTSAGRSSG